MIELKNNNKKLRLRDSLFWDINPDKLNAHSSIMLIVERVLTRGNMFEFKQLIKFYPEFLQPLTFQLIQSNYECEPVFE